MEVLWWIIALLVLIAIGAWINIAISGAWVTGALIGLIVWLVAGCIRLGAADDALFFIDW